MRGIRSIVLFDQYPFLGGGQTVFLAATEAARRTGAEVFVVVPPGGALAQVLNQRADPNVEVVATPACEVNHGKKRVRDFVRLGGYNLSLALRHFRLVFRSDILYANGPRQFPGLLFLSWLCRKKCIYHIHIDHSTIEKKLIAIAARLRHTHSIIVNSNYILNCLAAAIPGIKDNPRVRVIENGLDSRFSTLKFVDRYSGVTGRLKIAVIGVLRPEKGQDRAVELARINSDYEVHLVGRTGGGAEAWVEVLKQRAPSNVFFHGEVTDIPACVNQFGIQLNLVPSRWAEPFGLVAIEGMACSCITVVYDSGALGDIARKTGAIMCADEKELQAALKRVYEMKQGERIELAREQFDRTMKLYNAERFISEIQNIIETAQRAVH